MTQNTDTVSLSNENDLYIRVETADGSIVIPPTYAAHGQLYRYSLQIQELRNSWRAVLRGNDSTLSQATKTEYAFSPTPAT